MGIDISTDEGQEIAKSYIKDSLLKNVDTNLLTDAEKSDLLTSMQKLNLNMEMMKVNFQSISWAQFAIFDFFSGENKRETPESAINPAYIYKGKLKQNDDTPNKIFEFNSIKYLDINIIETGESTSVSTDTLVDMNKSWYNDEVKGLILIDSSLNNFNVLSNTSTTLLLNGTPSSGEYILKDDIPQNAVVFCSFSDSTWNNGYGYVKLEVSFNNGSTYVTFLDTENSINKLRGTVDISSNTGKDFTVKITIKNDDLGNGPEIYNFLICTDPSPWRY